MNEPQQHRKIGPCLQCSHLGDESDKELHGLGLCGKHYQADLRRRGENPAAPSHSTRHAGRELKAHAYVAGLFQKFLLNLNDDRVTSICTAEYLQEVRLLLHPQQTVSQRFCVPRSLPTAMMDTYEEPSEPSAPAKVKQGNEATSLFFVSPVASTSTKKRKSRAKVKLFPDNPPAKSGDTGWEYEK